MEANQVITVLKKLENTYGVYSQEQVRLIIKPAMKLEMHDFEYVVEGLILEGKKPTPKTVLRKIGEAHDRASARRAKLNQSRIGDTQSIEAHKKCQICKDSGFVLHKKASKETGITIFAGCLCEKASQDFGYNIEQPNEAGELPRGFFKPQGNIWEKMQEWKEWRSTSRSYWEDQIAKQQDLPFF
jgi:hypothetical protein